MDLSYSQSAVARSCWMKYKFKYVDGLRPIDTKPSLTLGKAVHDAFDLFYNGKDNQTIVQYINTIFKDKISTVGPQDVEALELAKYTALGMWLYYPHKTLNFQDIKPEVEFKLPIINDINFVGRVDGLVKKNNKYWLRELKTTGLSMRQFEGRMHTSYQATGYIWAMQKVTGHKIQGVMYDVIKKPLLRKRVSEMADDFGRRIMEDYSDEKKQKHYFQRLYTYRTEDDVKRYEEDRMHLVGDICRRKKSNMWYRNPESCWQFNSECPYKKICFCDKPDQLIVDLMFTKKEDNEKSSSSKS